MAGQARHNSQENLQNWSKGVLLWSLVGFFLTQLNILGKGVHGQLLALPAPLNIMFHFVQLPKSIAISAFYGLDEKPAIVSEVVKKTTTPRQHTDPYYSVV
ncbi:hypothetical protein GDO78_014007 [Eleutherodactylus coqui]|uniref:Uncharacterized protein n=1 Tax=Eleutherodactylus coqui TaxID=57060 RepID=A0A8J6EP62_ELECQ|nr:hypothetical protein GDO78_014007 [Eleutherodactylus coqui]